MAEPTAQQLARQRLAATDLAKFAPPPPKRKKAEPEQPKYTTPAVKMSACHNCGNGFETTRKERK